KKSGIGYKIVSSNHIVYLEGPKKKGLFARKKESKKTRRTDNTAVKPAVITQNMTSMPVMRDTALPGRIVIVGDSSLAMAYYFSGGGNSGAAYNAAGSGVAKVPNKDAWT